MPRRTAPRRPSRPAPAARPGARWPARRPGWPAVGVAAVVAVGLGVGAWRLAADDPARLRARAEAAEAAGDWPSARDAWRSLNRTPAARGRTWLAEARACLAIDLAAQAEAALARACRADPADPEPWRLRLDILRTEGRTTEALRVGWEAYGAVGPGARRPILRELTLALLLPGDALDDLPDDRSRARVDRWAAADPGDADAAVARRRRAAAMPRPGEADLAGWIATLDGLLGRDPGRAAAREALVVALTEAGEPERARSALDAWPEADRDGRYHRLDARWQLDQARRPDLAAAAVARALADLPHDWRARSLLARAERALGRADLAAREAARVDALRERLDPSALVPRLAADLARPDDPSARLDLADLCAFAGLDRLAVAWRREADAAPIR